MRDAWRLAVGTLTALPTAPPRSVGPAEARWAMLLAPAAVLPLGLVVGVVVALPLAPLVVGVLAVGLLVLGTRALHVDGLSDTADGLSASYDRERSLEVMRSGTSGPAGGAAVLLVLLLQVAALGSLAASTDGWRAGLVAGVLVCVSRLSLWLTCRDGVPAARVGGLGGSYVGVVPRPVAVGGWSVALVAVSLVCLAVGLPWWRGLLSVALAAAAVLWLVRRTVRRLGGVTGDVFGAAVELCLAALLVGVVA